MYIYVRVYVCVRVHMCICMCVSPSHFVPYLRRLSICAPLCVCVEVLHILLDLPLLCSTIECYLAVKGVCVWYMHVCVCVCVCVVYICVYCGVCNFIVVFSH